MTSVCGFISRWDRPYSVYYALIHNTRKDIFVRLSISVGDWWRHDTCENRHAACIDVTPGSKRLRMTVLEPIHSPQQNFAKFGRWLGPKAGRDDPEMQELIKVAEFIVAHDPAVLTYLSGRRPDYSGREVRLISEN
jgi:hypothetical protein